MVDLISRLRKNTHYSPGPGNTTFTRDSSELEGFLRAVLSLVNPGDDLIKEDCVD
jgi:hypothetical protein